MSIICMAGPTGGGKTHAITQYVRTVLNYHPITNGVFFTGESSQEHIPLHEAIFDPIFASADGLGVFSPVYNGFSSSRFNDRPEEMVNDQLPTSYVGTMYAANYNRHQIGATRGYLRDLIYDMGNPDTQTLRFYLQSAAYVYRIVENYLIANPDFPIALPSIVRGDDPRWTCNIPNNIHFTPFTTALAEFTVSSESYRSRRFSGQPDVTRGLCSLSTKVHFGRNIVPQLAYEITNLCSSLPSTIRMLCLLFEESLYGNYFEGTRYRRTPNGDQTLVTADNFRDVYIPEDLDMTKAHFTIANSDTKYHLTPFILASSFRDHLFSDNPIFLDGLTSYTDMFESRLGKGGLNMGFIDFLTKLKSALIHVSNTAIVGCTTSIVLYPQIIAKCQGGIFLPGPHPPNETARFIVVSSLNRGYYAMFRTLYEAIYYYYHPFEFPVESQKTRFYLESQISAQAANVHNQEDASLWPLIKNNPGLPAWTYTNTEQTSIEELIGRREG